MRIRNGDPIWIDRGQADDVVHVAAKVSVHDDILSTLTTCTQDQPYLRVSHYKATIAYHVPTCLWCIAGRTRR